MKRPDPRVTLVRDDLIIADIQPKLHTVRLPITGVYRRGSKASGLDTQLVFGTVFNVYDIKGRWAWGQEVPVSGKSAYVGYVPLASLSQSAHPPNKKINVLRAPLFAKPDLKSQVRSLLPLNALIETSKRTGDYLAVMDMGFIHKNHISALKSRAGDFVGVAGQHYGLPYIWGGLGPDGLDCSGLILSSLRAVGRAGPRDTDMQERALGKAVEINKSLTGLMRGDLVFWKGHVGVMTNSKTLLHANAYHMQVESEPLKEAARRIKKIAGPITSIKRLSWV